MKDNLILIGYMGCGKTTIGKSLALKYGYKFLDTDEWIEKLEQMKIKDMFALKGESYFRNLETKILTDFQEDLSHTVLSTGGGMPCNEANQELLRGIGTVIYLKVSKETITKRLRKDTTRPLLLGEDLENKIEMMLQMRDPIYQRVADYVIETDGKEVEKILEEIYAIMKQS